MNIKDKFTELGRLDKLYLFILKKFIILKFLFGKLNWILIYGPPRTGTTLLSEIAAYESKFMIVDVGLQLMRVYPENSKWQPAIRNRLYNFIYLNLLSNSHEGTWFCYNRFKRPYDFVLKQAALRIEDYNYLVKLFGAPKKTYFCVREPSAYSTSHLKKFSKPSYINDDYLRSLIAYEKIGGTVVDYSCTFSLEDYENIIFGKKKSLPIKVAHKNYQLKKSNLTHEYKNFKKKNIDFFASP